MLNERKHASNSDSELPHLGLGGIVASPGFATGTAVLFTRAVLTEDLGPPSDPAREVERFLRAVQRAREALAELRRNVRSEFGDEAAHIFRVQETILEDETVIDEIRSLIRGERCSAGKAVDRVFSSYFEMFADLHAEDRNRQRIADLEDVKTRLMEVLSADFARGTAGTATGSAGSTASGDASEQRPQRLLESIVALPEDGIVVARELYPSDTVTLDREKLKGMITERGSALSHVAILARSLGIPAAVAVPGAIETIRPGDRVFLDCSQEESSRVYINPDERAFAALERRRDAFVSRVESTVLETSEPLEPITRDGRRIGISANIGSLEEVRMARRYGGTSAGLVRSEFLFLQARDDPDEQTQIHAYRTILEGFPEGHVTVRTFDGGADKLVPSGRVPVEDNPALGYRGIRIAFDREETLRRQLRALLRASTYGTLKVMFPMVADPDQVRYILSVFREVRTELHQAGYPCDDAVDVGVMIEVPSAVVMVEEIASLVDFVSIGTNDLTQYLLAADRTNELVRQYYQPYHPAVFRTIRTIVEGAHRHGASVSVCGELGGMALAIPLLLGLGVDELSMNADAIAAAVRIVRGIRDRDARELAQRISCLDSEPKVRDVLRAFVQDASAREAGD